MLITRLQNWLETVYSSVLWKPLLVPRTLQFIVNKGEKIELSGSDYFALASKTEESAPSRCFLLTPIWSSSNNAGVAVIFVCAAVWHPETFLYDSYMFTSYSRASISKLPSDLKDLTVLTGVPSMIMGMPLALNAYLWSKLFWFIFFFITCSISCIRFLSFSSNRITKRTWTAVLS